jgi:hypothetical protein
MARNEQGVEQEVARGASERTPVFLLSGVTLAIACVFAAAVAIAVAAYLLAR